MRMTMEQCHADVLVMLERVFGLVRGRIEFYEASPERKLALAHLDQAYEYTVHLAKQEQVESLNEEQVRLRQVR